MGEGEGGGGKEFGSPSPSSPEAVKKFSYSGVWGF